MGGVLDEYLVKLGFSTDQAGLSRFQNAMREAEGVVTRNVGEMVRAITRTGVEVGAGFAAIGAAAIGMADKVAMADQSYRLFALHMYMSKDTARSLKIAMDALGEPLENLTWDKELQDRTRQLIEDQRHMAPGGDFDAQMRKIRDIRFEFTRMHVELEYLSFNVVQKFMQALGTGPDQLLAKLRQFNDWVIKNMPTISSTIAQYLVPVFKDVWQIMSDVWEVASSLGETFADIINTIAGNQASIDPSMTKWEKFAAALQSSANAITSLLNTVTKIVKFLEPNAATIGGAYAGAKFGSLFGPEGTGVGLAVGGVLGGVIDLIRAHNKNVTAGASPSSASGLAQQAVALAQQVSAKTGVPASLIWAQWAHETGGFTHLGAVNNLAGINVPGGGGQDYRSFSSLNAFASYYTHLLESSRYSGVLTATNAAQFAAGLKRGGYYGDTLGNYTRGLSYWQGQYQGGVTVNGGVHVTVSNPNHSVADVQAAVARGLQDAANKRVQRNLQQLNSYGWAAGG